MPTSADAPLLTVQSVVQGLASDSALLLSLVTTVERTATPEQKAAFVRHFVSVLLLCRDESVFAASELLGELFLLDLDEAMWCQGDPAMFLRRPSTIVSSLVDQLSRETFSSPEGNLLPHLVSTTRVLSAGDDASTTSSDVTPMGVSPGAWSRHSEDGPFTSATTRSDGMNVYDRFSTSELVGLSTAEQQFFGDLGRSPYGMNSYTNSSGGTGMEGSRPPVHVPKGPSQPPLSVSSNGVRPVGGPTAANLAYLETFRYTRDTDTSNECASRSSTARHIFTNVQVREAVDFFADAATWPDPKAGAHSPELALGVVDVRAEAVLILAFQIQEVVAKHISECPLVLRRAFWIWLRAASGRSGPPDSADVSPAPQPSATFSTEAETPPLMPPSSPSSSTRSVSVPSSSQVSFEFVGMTTMVMLHMLTPLLLSLPSFVLPVEENEHSEAFVTTMARFRFMAKLLQKAAYGVLFDERFEAGLTPLNRGMRELHRRWVSCFSALADYRTASSMNWCCPLPSPTRGVAPSAAERAQEQTVLQRYFQFLDGFLVPYLQTTVLLRRFTEAIHLPQWLRCTYFATRFVTGQIGSVKDSLSGAATRPPLITAIPSWDYEAVAADALKKATEDEKLLWMSAAVSHVVDGFATAHTRTPTGEVGVSAFMANFISFLGTSHAKVTTLVVYEDLLQQYWAQFAASQPATTVTSGGEAADVLAFYVYLAVQHNVMSPQFQLALIPSVSSALQVEFEREAGQSHREDKEPSTTTTDTLRWLWEVMEAVPLSYRRHCDRIWTATITSGHASGPDVALERQHPQQQAAFKTDTPHMPRLRICASVSEMITSLFKGLSSYISLSADDYHWMVCEQQRQSQQQQQGHGEAHTSRHVDVGASNSTTAAVPHAAPVAAENASSPLISIACPLRPGPAFVWLNHRVPPVSSLLSGSATLRSLRLRWRRPLAVSESLRASGILPLHSTRAIFELASSITCRRLWTDGTLQPVAGVRALDVLMQPLCAVVQLYGAAADVAATLLDAVDATPPPQWLRELQFCHGSVMVHAGAADVAALPSDVRLRRSKGGLAPSTPAPLVGKAPSSTDAVHWPQCAWFYPLPEAPAANDTESSSSNSGVHGLATQWEALMQHVIFFSSEFDANVTDDDDESNVADQILSTRWGLSRKNHHHDSASPGHTAATHAAAGGDVTGEGERDRSASAACTSSSATEGIGGGATALHVVPSLRHLSIESLWRLFLFNVRQTCHIMRRMTPRECPFYRMEGAIAEVLRNGTSKKMSPTIVVRPGFDETSTTLSERICQAAADALRSCFPSEVTLVRLIVSVAAYIRNVHTVLHRLRDADVAVPESASIDTYHTTVQQGTAQLLYGHAALMPAQERLVELLCFDGDMLTQKAFLPYYENCTWHPYGRLMYDC